MFAGWSHHTQKCAFTTSQAITRAEKPIQSRPTRLGIERTRYARPTNRSESASTTCLSSIATVSGSLRAEGWLLRSEPACDEPCRYHRQAAFRRVLPVGRLPILERQVPWPTQRVYSLPPLARSPHNRPSLRSPGPRHAHLL